jgi:hydroxymethylglutaryl-CoA lyase
LLRDKGSPSYSSVVSCIFADPYSGPTSPADVLYVVKRLLDMGCYEVGLGDTLGVGTPEDTKVLLEVLLKEIPVEKLAYHFHDTYGQAVANVVKAYEMGVRAFDSSVAGRGGCPYAVGAKGNLSTEDIVYMFEKSGIQTGVDIDKLVAVGEWISKQLGQPNGSRAGAAMAAKQKAKAGTSKPSPTPASSRNWKLVEDTGKYTVSRSGSAVKVTLTRPQNGNAMTNAIVDGLTRLFTDLAHDKTVFHILIAADGKFFCTGMDLSGGTNTSDMSSGSNYYSKVVGLYAAIDNAPQTTIAVVNGQCYGGRTRIYMRCAPGIFPCPLDIE